MVKVNNLRELLSLRAQEDRGLPFITEPDAGGSLSFAELEAGAEAVWERLRRHDPAPGERVASFCRNGCAAVLSFFAAAARGAVALPLSPEGTGAELGFILEHAGARFILAEASLAPELEKKLPALRRLEPPAPGLSLYRHFPAAPPAAPPPGTAMLLYTSGTTGRPKGVPLSQANLLAECANIRQAHRLEKTDKALCLLPLHHINGLVVTLLTPLFVGLEVLMPPRFSAGRFWHWLGMGATWFSAVPTIYSILLSRPMPAASELRGLRFMRSASAALPEAVLREFEQRTGVPLIESYGISEGGSQITSNPLPPAARKPGSVGLPFGNELKILPADGGEAPAGVSGEVLVRGANIAPGYFNNPQATAESFKDGWFHTGDLGFMDAEGYLFLRGRKKELINRAGEMISPREIDEALYLHPGVELAAALGVPHPLYGEEVVAFVRARAGHSPAEEEIRALCRDRLSGFKVPKRIYFIDDFPRGPSGKIQRLKLVERYLALPAREQLA